MQLKEISKDIYDVSAMLDEILTTKITNLANYLFFSI